MNWSVFDNYRGMRLLLLKISSCALLVFRFSSPSGFARANRNSGLHSVLAREAVERPKAERSTAALCPRAVGLTFMSIYDYQRYKQQRRMLLWKALVSLLCAILIGAIWIWPSGPELTYSARLAFAGSVLLAVVVCFVMIIQTFVLTHRMAASKSDLLRKRQSESAVVQPSREGRKIG